MAHNFIAAGRMSVGYLVNSKFDSLHNSFGCYESG